MTGKGKAGADAIFTLGIGTAVAIIIAAIAAHAGVYVVTVVAALGALAQAAGIAVIIYR